MMGNPPLLAYLRDISIPTSGPPRRYPISATETAILGRDPRCQVVIDPVVHRTVSRNHAEIVPIVGGESGLQWQVCDRGSSNGTYLNRQRIQGCQILQSGDHISLGRNGPEFIFEIEKTSASRSGVNLPAVPGPSPAMPMPIQGQIRETGMRHDGRSGQGSRDSVSLTQLFPIFSTGGELARKAYLIPGGLTVLFVVLMFLAVGDATLFNFLLASYLTGAAYFFIYQLCGKRKPWGLILAMPVVTALLMVSPVLDFFLWFFREVLPGGNLTEENPSFWVLLVRMFFGAGLMEELLKAIPVLFLYGLGMGLKSPWRERWGVREPLDGILLGAAAAVGFTLIETLRQYVPDIYQATLGAGENAAQLAGLQLLIPRILGLVAGHMAYSGYFGYAIGLSALRPRQRWMILGVGYLTASGLHALWNATGKLHPLILALVGLMSYAFLAAAILKARELSPTRSQNFATRLHRDS